MGKCTSQLGSGCAVARRELEAASQCDPVRSSLPWGKGQANFMPRVQRNPFLGGWRAGRMRENLQWQLNRAMLPSAKLSLSQFFHSTWHPTRSFCFFLLFNFVPSNASLFSCHDEHDTNDATVSVFRAYVPRTGMLGHAQRSRTIGHLPDTLIRETATRKMWLCYRELQKRKSPEMKMTLATGPQGLALEIRKWMRSHSGFRAFVDPVNPVNPRVVGQPDAGSTDRSTKKGKATVLRAIPMTNSGAPFHSGVFVVS